MGTFSWLKAYIQDTEIINICEGKPFKFLIPEKFGGGYIKDDYYAGYGILDHNKDKSPKYDMYEILAFWNCPDRVKYDGEFPFMKQCDKYTDYNRDIGIAVGSDNISISKLQYPLKLVSASFEGSYEDVDFFSLIDPYQGMSPLPKKSLESLCDHSKTWTKFQEEYANALILFGGNYIACDSNGQVYVYSKKPTKCTKGKMAGYWVSENDSPYREILSVELVDIFGQNLSWFDKEPVSLFNIKSKRNEKEKQ